MQILPMNNINPMGTYEDQPLKIQRGYEVYDEYNNTFIDLQSNMDFPESKDNTTRAKEVLAQIVWLIKTEPNDYPDCNFLQQFLGDDCRNDEQSSIWIHGVASLNYMDCVQIWENPEIYLPIKDRISELRWMVKPGEDATTNMNNLGFPTGNAEYEEYSETLAIKRAVFLETFANPEYKLKDSTFEEKEKFIDMASELVMNREFTTAEAVLELFLYLEDCPIKNQKQHNYPHQVEIINKYYKIVDDVIYGEDIAQIRESNEMMNLEDRVHDASLDEDGSEVVAYVPDSVKEAFLLLEDKETARKFMKSAFRRKDEYSGLWLFDENKSDFEVALPSMRTAGNNKVALSLYSKEEFEEYCQETDIGPEDEYTGGYKHWANDMFVQDWVEGNDDTLIYEEKVLEAYIEQMLKMDDYESRVFRLANQTCGMTIPEILTNANESTQSSVKKQNPKNNLMK